MKKALVLFFSIAAMVSCSKAPKTLILYYSQTGATEAVANEIQKQIGGDIERIDVIEAYDGNYPATIQRYLEERESGFRPTLVPIKSDLSKYDVIFLGYPVWFGTYARPVEALLASVNLEGKKIVPFCTFGSGGIVSSSEDLRKALPQSEIAEGFGIRNARIQYAEEELNRFLIEGGWKAGKIEPLPEFSEQDAVIPEERALYEEATAGYPYPMGEPVSVASRTVPGGVDFLFIAEGRDMAGNPAQSKVYVARRNGRNTEFTQVVR